VKGFHSFDGSAGTAIVPSSSINAKALLFVDSRYWVQAERQIPKAGWEVVRVGATGGSGPSAVQQGFVDWIVKVSDALRLKRRPRAYARLDSVASSSNRYRP